MGGYTGYIVVVNGCTTANYRTKKKENPTSTTLPLPTKNMGNGCYKELNTYIMKLKIAAICIYPPSMRHSIFFLDFFCFFIILTANDADMYIECL